jgi:sulfhydrogenase subunit gamma (sulfur reductase)
MEMDLAYKPKLAKVLEVKELTAREKLFILRLENGEPLNHQPGQFVEVSVFGVGECPISICSSPTRGPEFQMCVRAIGNVTNAIHQLKPGDYVGIRGPYGRGFPVEEAKGQDLLLAAGGLGMAPLRSFIQYLMDRSIGQCYLTVDQGDETWQGHVGVITTLCPIVKVNPQRTIAITVGPPVMYKFILKEFLKMGIPEDRIYVDLERHMKCGVGKCGHCQINGLYVCKEGPVFKYTEIKELPEAI